MDNRRCIQTLSDIIRRKYEYSAHSITYSIQQTSINHDINYKECEKSTQRTDCYE